MWNSKKVDSILRLSAIVLLLIVFSLFGCKGEITSEDQARRAAVGVWTSCVPNHFWGRLVLKVDGTYEDYLVMPSSDDWGKPISLGRCELSSGKYIETGKRYYGVKFERGYDLIFVDDQNANAVAYDGSIQLVYQKGDAHPFSN